MLNVAILMGRLVADPEIRHTPNDIAVTSFTIAVDRSYVKPAQNAKRILLILLHGAQLQSSYVSIFARVK